MMKTKSFIARRAFIGRLRPFISRAAAFIARRAICLLALLLATAPAFAEGPDLLVCYNKGYTLTSAATATGSGLTYTWYESSDEGKTYTIQGGQTAATLSVAAKNTQGTYLYVRTVKSESCPGEIPSNTYTIAVLRPEAPTIISPSAATVCQSFTASSVTFGIAPQAFTTYSWTSLGGQLGTVTNNTSSYTVSGNTSGTVSGNTVTATASVSYTINGHSKVCKSPEATAASVTIHPYPTIAASTFNFCGSGAQTLTVVVTTNNSTDTVTNLSTISWYADSNGSVGSEITSGVDGAKYGTSVLTATTHYYVAATTDKGCDTEDKTKITAHPDAYEGVIRGDENPDDDEG